MARRSATRSVTAIFLAAMLAPASQAQVADEGIGKARQLLLEQDGWSVYRARNGQTFTCFAYKLAEGEAIDPAMVRGSGMALGMLSGARGFKLYIADDAKDYEYGLFGKEFYTGIVALEANGKIYNAIYSFGDLKLPELLKLDGVRAEIEVTTYRYKSRIGEWDKFSGHLDFTGLAAAHAALASCHRDKPPLP